MNITENGERYRLSVPGGMVQLLGEFETTKAYADLAYWDIADDYADTTVQNDQPNGQ